MLDLAVNGYTREQVMDCLHGRSGSRGKVTFRYDLLSKEDVKLGELQAQPGRVTLNSLAEIKRTAVFQITEQEGKDIDWLSDRIRPVFCLKMPEIRKTGKAWGKIDASFSRSSIAYLSDGTRVAANVPRFEPGKFGKAIIVEEGTENLVINGSIENNLSYWYATNDTSAGDNGVVRRIVGDAAVGNACLEYEITNRPSWGFFHNDYNQYSTSPYFDTSKQYTISFWAKRISGSNIMHVKISDANGRNVVWSGGSFTLYDTWTRYTFTFTPAIAGNQPVVFFNYYIAGQTGKCRIDGLQIEQQRYATSFIDGTRSPESLIIPTAGVLNPQEGTVEFWVKPLVVANWNNFFDMVTSNGRFLLFFATDGRAMFDYGPSNTGPVAPAGTIQADDWHHIVLRWSAATNKHALFVNGVKYEKDLPSGVADSFPVTVNVVNNYSAFIDDLRISNRARTDAEILAEYQRNKPHLIDQWTTAKFSFDDKLSGDYFTLVDRDISAQWIEWPLGVFLLSSPTRKDENKQVKRSIEAYDSSLILKEDKFTDRYLIAAGTKYTTAIIDILNNAGIWKINIIDHPGRLATDREFEIGTAKLTAINELLAAINYTSLWVDENGYFVAQPYVLPSDRDPEYEYRTDDLSIIHPGAEEELDLFAVPNKFVRYVSNPDRAVVLRSEYTNDLSTSPISTVNRGRTIVDIDYVEDIYDQATLDEYVKRIAYNASQVYGKFEFATALMPHHSYYNCLFVEHKDLNIAHKYMESSWSMDLHANGVMRHSCRRVINI